MSAGTGAATGSAGGGVTTSSTGGVTVGDVVASGAGVGSVDTETVEEAVVSGVMDAVDVVVDEEVSTGAGAGGATKDEVVTAAGVVVACSSQSPGVTFICPVVTSSTVRHPAFPFLSKIVIAVAEFFEPIVKCVKNPAVATTFSTVHSLIEAMVEVM